MIYKNEKDAQALIDAWNKTNGIGAAVRVHKDDGTILETTTRSKAAMLPSGQPVIWVRGLAGCYDLTRVSPILEDAE